jgi:hypothetical protein
LKTELVADEREGKEEETPAISLQMVRRGDLPYVRTLFVERLSQRSCVRRLIKGNVNVKSDDEGEKEGRISFGRIFFLSTHLSEFKKSIVIKEFWMENIWAGRRGRGSKW